MRWEIMSVQALSWVLDHSESTLAARHVLISIANHAKKDGTGAWPSIATISREAKVSESSVHRSIIDLQGLGELSVQVGEGPYGTNLYTLTKMIRCQDDTVPNVQEGGVKQEVQMTPEPSFKPSLNQPSLENEVQQEEPKGVSDRDMASLWKDMRSVWKRQVGGRSIGSGLKGRYGEKFVEVVERHGTEKVLLGFEEFIESKGPTYLKTLRFPMSQFIQEAEVFIEDASVQIEEPKPEQVAGPRGLGPRYAHLVKP
jgi:hypothetical protein